MERKPLPLKIALADRGIVQALRDGHVRPLGITVEHIQVDPIIAAMRRMVRGFEFDVCEMALSTYVCARTYGKPLIAIPVFISRNFHHRAVFRNVSSRIKAPKDLEGQVVGVHRGYTVTTGLWARGILQTEYGVNLNSITWAATSDEHVTEYRAPGNVDYSCCGQAVADLLRTGELGAAVGDIRADTPEVEPLLADPERAAGEYFLKTGIFPINHTVVIKSSILDAEPWVAKELFLAFKAAKEAYIAYLDYADKLTAADRAFVALQGVVGKDPFPFGIEPNRRVLETFVQFAVDQQVIPNIRTVTQLFAPETLDLT
jgi:4,5-dihydroxyphthalate decarboxylase